MSRSVLISVVSAFVFGGIALSGTPAVAASTCKGLDLAKCGAASGCSWVKSYKNKSGKTVAAHCRAKGKKAAKGKPPSKPKTN